MSHIEEAIEVIENTSHEVSRLDSHTSQGHVNDETSHLVSRLLSQLWQAQRNSCTTLSTWMITRIFKLQIIDTTCHWFFILPLLEHENRRLELKPADVAVSLAAKGKDNYNLQALPQDIKLQIIALLTPVHATALGVTCKTFYFAYKHFHRAPMSLETAIWERCIQCGGGVVRHKLHEYLRGWVKNRRLTYDAGKAKWVQPVLSRRTWAYKGVNSKVKILKKLGERKMKAGEVNW